MAQYVEVNGQNIEFPDGMAVGDIEAALKKNALSLPAAVSAGQAINANLNSIPRQLGLTARYGLEGLAQAAQIGTEPIRHALIGLGDASRAAQRQSGGILAPNGRKLSDLVTGEPPSPQTMIPLGEGVSSLSDIVGLPKPESANERVIGDAARLVAGAGGMGGLANKAVQAGATPVSNYLAQQFPGAIAWGQNLLRGLAANPTQQLAAAGGAGLAGGASREAGGSPMLQAGASLIGGVAGGLTPRAVEGVANVGRRVLTPALTPQQLDVQLSTVLGKTGTDFGELPTNVQNSLRAQLKDSLQAGKELDPEAVRRLADFATVKATPTRGMVSQNPVQITREQNLAKMAANSSDGSLHGLPLLQNQNNTTLINRLNESGAAKGDAFAAGERAIGSIAARDAAEAQRVTGLYNAARSMPGGDIPLNRAPVVSGIYDALAKENKLAFLPPEVSNMLNTISKGSVKIDGREFPVPFDANALDNLMTTIATAQRGTSDGNVKAALSIARNAIDSAGISPLKNNARVVGNPLVTAEMGDALRNADAQAPQFMAALNDARAAARGRFAWQESARPIEAALGGAAPDTFVKRFVIGGTLEDAQAIAKNAPASGMKDAIAAYLKDKALNGSADEVGKFSQSAYNKALNQIGDRKLGVFFSPDELAQLKAVGRVASYMQSQPVGSAVNNSNSGALVLGRGMDALNSIAGKIPFGKAAVIDPIRNLNISISQRQAQNVVPGLLAPTESRPLAPSLLLPGLAVGGGLLSP